MCGVLSSPFRRNVSKKGYLTQQDFCRILCSHITLIILRKLLPYLLDQTRQLSKLVDYWVNVNGERAWGPQRCRQCQKTSAWVSKRAMVARSEGHRKRAIMAERTRIAAREDRWRDNSRCSKCRCARWHRVCARWHRVCAHPRALSRLNVAVLCVDMDTVHGCCKTTRLPLFCSKKFTAREVPSETKRLRKQKRTK